MNTKTRRITAAVAAAAVVTGIGFAATGAANAGTLPVTHHGQPTVAMTITNHTNRFEWLRTEYTDGQFVNAPQQMLAPHASETVVATAPFGRSLNTDVGYQVGVFGPTANYSMAQGPWGTNTGSTSVFGNGSGPYWINTQVNTGSPNVNAGYDLW